MAQSFQIADEFGSNFAELGLHPAGCTPLDRIQLSEVAKDVGQPGVEDEDGVALSVFSLSRTTDGKGVFQQSASAPALDKDKFRFAPLVLGPATLGVAVHHMRV